MLWRQSIYLVALATALLPTFGRAQAFDESKYPDWSGQWVKVPDGGPPRYDPSKPDGRGQQAPLKEPYRRMHEASMADQASGGQGLYISSVKCIPMGMPFEMSIVFPFEFVITEKTTFILYEIMTSQPRRIYTDGRDWPKDQDPLFTGYSIGRWIDTTGSGRYDTLEVETRDLRVPRLFDQTGISFAEDGQAVIKERFFTDKANPKIVHDEITTIDNALTRPWTVLKSYQRMPRVTWTENNCTEGNDNIAIGNEVYLMSGDGRLMPIKKGEPPPDLSYFKQQPK
jgi:hypothetical protein